MSAPISPTILRIRVMCGEDAALGPGKVDMLEAIHETGTISAAGRKLGLSYRKAWILVDAMNRCFREPVVEAAKGGSHGGGAHVTELGLEVVRRYRDMQTRAWAAIEAPMKAFEHLMATPEA